MRGNNDESEWSYPIGGSLYTWSESWRAFERGKAGSCLCHRDEVRFVSQVVRRWRSDYAREFYDLAVCFVLTVFPGCCRCRCVCVAGRLVRIFVQTGLVCLRVDAIFVPRVCSLTRVEASHVLLEVYPIEHFGASGLHNVRCSTLPLDGGGQPLAPGQASNSIWTQRYLRTPLFY